MKKEFVLIILTLMIFGFFFVYAEESATTGSSGEKNTAQSDNAQNLPSVDASSVQKKSNEILAKEIEIPERLQILTKFLFGWKNTGEITLQIFIILVSLWIAALILIKSGVELLVPGWKAWAISLAISFIGSTTGALETMANFLLGLGSLFGLIKEWNILTLIVTLFVVGIIFVLVEKFLTMLKNQNRVEDLRKAGEEIHTERNRARIISRSY